MALNVTFSPFYCLLLAQACDQYPEQWDKIATIVDSTPEICKEKSRTVISNRQRIALLGFVKEYGEWDVVTEVFNDKFSKDCTKDQLQDAKKNYENRGLPNLTRIEKIFKEVEESQTCSARVRSTRTPSFSIPKTETNSEKKLSGRIKAAPISPASTSTEIDNTESEPEFQILRQTRSSTFVKHNPQKRKNPSQESDLVTEKKAKAQTKKATQVSDSYQDVFNNAINSSKSTSSSSSSAPSIPLQQNFASPNSLIGYWGHPLPEIPAFTVGLIDDNALTADDAFSSSKMLAWLPIKPKHERNVKPKHEQNVRS